MFLNSALLADVNQQYIMTKVYIDDLVAQPWEYFGLLPTFSWSDRIYPVIYIKCSRRALVALASCLNTFFFY